MSNAIRPADAIKALFEVIQTEGLFAVRAFVAEDLAATRRAYPDDDAFVSAVLAIVREIRAALRSPKKHGIALDHDLHGWRRSKFCALGEKEATLRIVFRPTAANGVELLAFGHRNFPSSVYFKGARRTR